MTRLRPMLPAAWIFGAIVVPAVGVRAQDPEPSLVRTWLLVIQAQNVYDSNVRFQSVATPDNFTQLAGTGGFSVETGRSGIDLGVHAEQAVYRRLTDLNQFTYGGSADVKRALSPRLATAAFASYTVRALREATLASLSTAALDALPTTLSHTLAASAGASYAVAEQTTFRSDAAFTRVTFDAANLIDGSSISARESLAHKYSTLDAFGVSYQFQDDRTAGNTVLLHTLLADWTLAGSRVDIGIHGGASMNSSATSGRVAPDGSIELRRRAPFGVVFARYDHTVTQAFGFGRVLQTDNVGGGADFNLVGFRMHAEGIQWRGSDHQQSGYQLNATTAELDANRDITSVISLSAGGYYRRRAETTTASDLGVRLALGYVGSARGAHAPF